MIEFPRIKTAEGVVFHADWCGVASIDGRLRFAIPNANISAILRTFMREESLPVTYQTDEDEETDIVYSDFMEFDGAEKDFLGNIIVILAKG